MKKYQIVDAFGENWHAGSKATNDCMQILEKIGFEKRIIKRNKSVKIWERIKRQFLYLNNFREIYNTIEKDSVVVMQNPFEGFQLTRIQTFRKLKAKKNVKFISIVHDVNLIRETSSRFSTEGEFKDMLEIADKLIVHNEKMKQWFIDYGISEDKLICLEIFDYLSEVSSEKKIEFSKKIQIAGNLNSNKSPYVYKLNQLKTEFDLFGINYEAKEEYENIKYHGAFPAEEVPNKLSTGFGLVWDGTSLDTCDGDTGRYLRYNNPHKLSLYLVSGIPVVIWDQAAEADFVKENKVGIVVSSLRDIEKELENLTEEEYFEMLKNAKVIQERLKEGYYLEKAIEKSL